MMEPMFAVGWGSVGVVLGVPSWWIKLSKFL